MTVRMAMEMGVGPLLGRRWSGIRRGDGGSHQRAD